MNKDVLKEIEKKNSQEDVEIIKIFTSQLDKIMSEKNITKDVIVYENIDGMSQSDFSNLRNGKKVPRVSQIKALSEFFKVPIDFFLKSTSTTNPLDWKKWTYKDIISLLIDMIEYGEITRIQEYSQDEYELYPVSNSFGFKFPNNNSYIHDKISEYLKMTKDIPWEYREVLKLAKEAFIGKLSEEQYHDELPY